VYCDWFPISISVEMALIDWARAVLRKRSLLRNITAAPWNRHFPLGPILSYTRTSQDRDKLVRLRLKWIGVDRGLWNTDIEASTSSEKSLQWSS
jgi:hypothetical protein